MELREQDHNKVIEMPTTTLGYNLPNRNSSSSSKLSSPILGEERSDQRPQSHALIFTDPLQTSSSHLYPPNPPILQPHRPRRDPDPSPIIISPPPTTTTTFRYRECLKNHAASMGGHVTDGCGEFMPNGEEGTPESFKCAACECHRNFHRKEPQGLVLELSQQQQQHVLNYHHHKNNNRSILQFPTPQYSHLNLHGMVAATTIPSGGPVQPVMLGFGGGPAESSSEDLNMFHQTNNLLSSSPVQVPVPPLSSCSNRKRFRTKFTQQQKDRMVEFAEKVGWKIQKQDEQELHQFCSQVGVKRQVFKVWMHNSKQAMKKKPMQA